MKKAIVLCVALLISGTSGMDAQNKLVKLLKESGNLSNKSKQNSVQSSPTGTTSRPGRSVNYYWDDQSSQWVYSDSSFYTYNLSGDLTSEIMRDGTPNSRYLNTYDAQGRITEELYQSWDGFLNTWQNNSRVTYMFNNQGYRTQYQFENYNSFTNQWEIQFGQKNILTYDASNRIIDNIYQNYNSTNNVWENGYRETAFTFDANNNILSLESKVANGANWDNDYKYNFVYSLNNQPVQLTMQLWNGNAYDNDARWINLVFHNWCGWYCDNIAIQSGTIQTWGTPQSNQWNNSERINSVYDAFGGYVETSETYTGTVWENLYRFTLSYNGNFVYTGSQNESWNTISNTWETDYQDKQIHTYDFSMNIAQTIWQYWDFTNSALLNQQKKVYANFTYVGINEDQNNLNLVKIFPNPCSGECHLEMDEAFTGKDESKEFVIYDSQGKQIHSEILRGSKLSFSTANFPQGIYFYQIKAQNQALKSGKLIVQ